MATKKRVVCLFPAATETLFALEPTSHFELIAIDHNSAEYFSSKPLGSTRVITSDKASCESFAAQTAAYRELAFMATATGGAALVPLLEFHLAVYHVDLAALAALPPADLVVTQVQVQGDWFGVREAEDALCALWKKAAGSVRIVQVDSKDLRGALQEMQAIGRALGQAEAGTRAAQTLAARMGVASQMARGRRRPRVALLNWIDPLYTAGFWASELLAYAAAEDIFAPSGHVPSVRLPLDPSQPFSVPSTSACAPVPALEVSATDIAARRPDFVCFAVCGISMLEARAQALEALRRDAAWGPLLRGRTQCQFIVFEANRLFSRQGPALLDSLEALVEALHAEVQPFGREAAGAFIRLDPASPSLVAGPAAAAVLQ